MEHENKFYRNNTSSRLLIFGMTVCSLLVVIPRLLWEGSRRPMAPAMGSIKGGAFDLTTEYELSGTPHWILDSQFTWHPFSERLPLATYEIIAVIVAITICSFFVWSHWRTSVETAHEISEE